MIELQEKGYNYAQLVLKHFGYAFYEEDEQDKQKKLEQTENEKKQNQIQEKNPKDKYSLDYSKFQNVSDDDVKQQELDQMMKENPYLSQMGCSHDRRKEREIFEKPTQEKLDNAEAFKLEGNKSMQEQEFEKAAYFYQKALVQFDYTFPENKELEARFNLLQEQCNINMAICKYKQKKPEDCLMYSKQALKINPKNEKALYRIAQIYYDQDKFDQCQKILEDYQKINPNSKELQQFKKQFLQKVEQSKEKDKKTYQSILNQLSNNQDQQGEDKQDEQQNSDK